VGLVEWCLIHLITALFPLWILNWGGAKWLEGWKSFFLIDWFAARWNAEQLRLYAFCILVFQGIWFLIGLVKPEYRGFA
jgi:hypothetical protein